MGDDHLKNYMVHRVDADAKPELQPSAAEVRDLVEQVRNLASAK
jgi:hypothetical protein